MIDVGAGHPDSPETTVIVPLYKRIDFVEHQLAQFAHDPEMPGVDLLYVLDSPEIADNLLDSAHALSALHGVPLRVAIMRRTRASQARTTPARASPGDASCCC